jgi:hypothetical protein
MRVPARWAVLAYVGLAGTAAIATDWLWRIRRIRALSVGVIGTLILISIPINLPVRWFRIPSPQPDVVTWLQATPSPGAIMEIPPGASFDYESTLHASTHLVRLVNGSSGFTPPHYRQLQSAFAGQHPQDSILTDLELWGVALLIVHADRLGDQTEPVQHWLARGVRAGRLAYVRRFDAGLTGDFVFAVTKHHPLADWERESSKAGSSDFVRWMDGERFFGSKRPFGILSSPAPKATVTGSLTVEGWVLSDSPNTAVRVCLANRRLCQTADRYPREELKRPFPEYETSTAGFRAHFAAPPRLLWNPEIDVEVVFTDATSEVTLFPHWIRWQRNLEEE